MSKLTKEPTGQFSPYYGCAIMLIAILVFGGMLGWGFYSLSRQDADIAQFTVEHPVPPMGLKLGEAELPALKAKLAAFAEEEKAHRPATLSLSVAELNSLIDLAPDTGAGSFREMIAFKALKPDHELVADVSLPLNKMKFWEGRRYAVGEATFTSEIVKDTGPDLRLTTLTIPGKPVNEGFLNALSSWHWLTPYQKLPALAPVFKEVKNISVTSSGVVLSTQE